MESLDHFAQGKFIMTDDMKRESVEALRCGVICDDSSVPTWTSQWVRIKGVSTHVYTLLKVKRWHLIDANYIFDPLNKCKSKFQLTPENTLWSNFPAGERSHTESKKSVDGLIFKGTACGVSFDDLTKLDSVLQSLDKAREIVNNPDYDPEDMMYFGPSGEHLYNRPSHFFFEDFFTDVGHAMNRLAMGDSVPEIVFRDIFCSLVQCVMACCGRVMRHIRCRRAVDTFQLDKVKLDVKLKGKGDKCPSLLISSKPDLFIFHRKDILLQPPRVVLAVVEVKGKRNDKIVHSDDDDDVAPCSCDEKQSAQEVTRPLFTPRNRSESGPSRLRAVDEEDEDDSDGDDDWDEETDLEKLIDEPPPWLGRIKSFPPATQKAIKKFLPQLIGEMYCAARCKQMKPLRHEDGLLFGIGVVGFEVYFVSMTDPCRDSAETVVNDESAVTNVFVTRPFDLLVKKDRRIILKTLCASFMLHQ